VSLLQLKIIYQRTKFSATEFHENFEQGVATPCPSTKNTFRAFCKNSYQETQTAYPASRK
jgi:hypothetical protein